MQSWEYTWERIWWRRAGVLSGSAHYELKHGDKHPRSRLEPGHTLKNEDVWDYINKLGKEGWELVSVIPEIQSSSTDHHQQMDIVLWFKRPI